ncbi:protein artichoke-like [Hylaeus volcanicus]|uniref:protein artichoke-like n=1 Tax=Hylaeus volcanicus TaxID=313075 RepID=UPI0023B83515|nr:protein artichoke-like [Hylaeus volcanicus]
MTLVHLLIISISIRCLLAQTISWDAVVDAGIEDTFFNHKKKETCDDEESVNLSNLELKEIPKHVVRSHAITSISMDNNQISDISTELLDDIPNLQCLNLARNRIPYGKMFGFKHDRLKTLILDHQKSPRSPSFWGSLAGNRYYDPRSKVSNKQGSFFPSLESLHLSGVDFEYFIPYFNKSFPVLSNLYLADNDLQYIREDIFSILPKHLKSLHLERNKLRELTFYGLSPIEELYLDGNPLDIVRIIDPYDLDVPVNSKLIKLSLNKLSLSNCNMTDERLDRVLSWYSEDVTTLDLSHNHLQLENYNFKSHSMLQHLSLTHNHLTTIPDINHLNRLNSISLSYNFIERVPKLTMPKSLKKLNLRGNKISEIENEAFANLVQLEALDLAGNQLKYLPQEWQTNLVVLRYLNLNENQFASIEYMMLRPLLNLREFHIAGNPIKSIDHGSLAIIPDQCTVYVLSNKETMAIELWKIVLLLSLQSISVHGFNFDFQTKKSHISKSTPQPPINWQQPSSYGQAPIHGQAPFYEQPPPYRRPNSTDVPREICENSPVILKLTRTGLKRVNDGFINSDKVTELHLDDNDITEISAGAFDFLPNLELLNLTGNNISTSRLLWFNKLSSLRTLILDGNKRRETEATLDHIFHPLLRLRELSLSRCGISRLTVNLKTFAPSLTRLRLSGNVINSSDFLEELPEYLIELNLDDNLLTSVGIGLTNGLEVLTVSGNKLEKLGDSSLSLKNALKMSKLNASRNRITEITENAFEDTKHLKVLDLSHNRLKTLSSRLFDELAYLEKLLVSHNQLTSMPNVNSLNSLNLLDLSGNHIHDIGNDSFNRTMARLETLLLANNHISNVDSRTFTKFSYLRMLDLSSNSLLDLPAHLINYTRYLKVFLLRDNDIVKIDDLRHVKSYSLEELHLQRNPLPHISLAALLPDNLPNLVIYINDPSKKSEEDDEKDDGDADVNDEWSE